VSSFRFNPEIHSVKDRLIISLPHAAMEGKSADLTAQRRCWAHLQHKSDMKKPIIRSHLTDDLTVSFRYFDP
jgi:hypothetical protein